MEKLGKQAGFWLRALATWIDLLVVYVALKIFFYLLLLSPFTVYFPFEFTFLVLFFVYSAILSSWQRQTVGKWLLGIQIASTSSINLSLVRVILRETLLKLLSTVALFLGFLWIGFTREKKGWHDIVVRSSVYKNAHTTIVNRYAKYVAIALFIILFGGYLLGMYSVYARSKEVSIAKNIDYPYIKRNIKEVTEVASLLPSGDATFTNWIQRNSQTPEDYAVDIAAKHKVTLFGEMHDQKENLDFFNRIIPALYHKSGVRCVALEVLPYTMNGKIEKLINGDSYDEDLALSIARKQAWRAWGSKGYWDVLKTVWRLNRTIADKSQKMHLVGIDEDWDAANLAFLSLGDDGLKNIPFVEKFRRFTVIDDLQKIVLRDPLMAYHIEKGMVKKGMKGVVWMGFDHTMTNFTRPVVNNGKILRTLEPRVGVLLKQKYHEQVAQIGLYLDMELSDKACLNSFIERIMGSVGSKGCAFSMENSPFAMLRDKESNYFDKYPTIVFKDLYEGIIYLKPLSQLKQCEWTKNFISKELFMSYRPFYCLKFNKIFTTPMQVNEYMEKRIAAHNALQRQHAENR
jgi:uncharacterized RDD family membrane protein YckC